MTKLLKIKPDERYTLLDIARNKFIPWCNSYWAVRKTVKLDIEGKNYLKAIVIGKGTETKYRFKGANIIKFVDLVESGKVKL